MRPEHNRNVRLALLILVLVISVLNTFMSFLSGLLKVTQGGGASWSRGTEHFLTGSLFMLVTAALMVALFRFFRGVKS